MNNKNRIRQLFILDIRGNHTVGEKDLNLSLSKMESISKNEFRIYFDANSPFPDKEEELKNFLNQFKLGDNYLLKSKVIDSPIILQYLDYQFNTSTKLEPVDSYLSFRVVFNSEVFSRLRSDIFS